jgi:hypothetical protein
VDEFSRRESNLADEANSEEWGMIKFQQPIALKILDSGHDREKDCRTDQCNHLRVLNNKTSHNRSKTGMLHCSDLFLALFANDVYQRGDSERRLDIFGRLYKRGDPMLTIMVFAAAIGIILGSYCRILVLLPMILLISGATFAAGFGSKVDVTTFAFVLLAIVATLQIGYVVGGIAGVYFSMRTKVLAGTIRPSRHY